jgi:hypothetical protein
MKPKSESGREESMAIDFDGDHKLPRTYTESDLKLERAAALHEAATIADATICEEFRKGWQPAGSSPRSEIVAKYTRIAIEALIPQSDASALDKLLAEARLEEADWWYQHAGSHSECLERLAALRAAPRDSGKAASQPTGTPTEPAFKSGEGQDA